jgi:hypothetical protein
MAIGISWRIICEARKSHPVEKLWTPFLFPFALKNLRPSQKKQAPVSGGDPLTGTGRKKLQVVCQQTVCIKNYE